MDHRWSARKRLQQRITLEAQCAEPVASAMYDVSLGGAFVDTGRMVLPYNATVIIGFSIPHSAQKNDFRIEAMVVRRNSKGAGLMFLRMKDDVIRSLSVALSEYSWQGKKAKRRRRNVGKVSLE